MATTKNITMKQFNGTDYDTLYPKTKIEQVEGAYTQQQILSDSTKTLYGLGMDAVPDDVLVWLAHFNSRLGDEYVWSKVETTTGVKESGTGSILSSGVGGTGDTISITLYSDYAINENGTIELTGESVTISGLYNSPPNVSPYVGYYGYDTPGNVTNSVYRVTSTSSATGQYSNGNYFLRITSCTKLILGEISNIIGYVNSSDPNAYPPAIPDGYIYMPLGRFGAKANIVTGSYVGTGTYGSSNPNSLTFDFPPKIMGVTENGSFQLGVSAADNRLSLVEAYTESFQFKSGFGKSVNNNGYGRKTNSGRTIEWYSTDSATSQMNESGKIYYYFAIG